MDWETKTALAGLAELGLPQSDANCRRWWKAVDIEANRLTRRGASAFRNEVHADCESDSRNLTWRVSVDLDRHTCMCECEDKVRHEDMAKKFGDPSGRHFCKHAIALLMRVRKGINSCPVNGTNTNVSWRSRAEMLLKGIDMPVNQDGSVSPMQNERNFSSLTSMNEITSKLSVDSVIIFLPMSGRGRVIQ